MKPEAYQKWIGAIENNKKGAGEEVLRKECFFDD